MTTADKIKGKAKEVIAEVIGDGELAEEGKDQQRERKIPRPVDMPPAERAIKRG